MVGRFDSTTAGQLGCGMALAKHHQQSHQSRSATHCCPLSPSLVPLLDATTREGESVLLCARLPRDSAPLVTLTLRSGEPHLLLD